MKESLSKKKESNKKVEKANKMKMKESRDASPIKSGSEVPESLKDAH